MGFVFISHLPRREKQNGTPRLFLRPGDPGGQDAAFAGHFTKPVGGPSVKEARSDIPAVIPFTSA